MMSQQDSGTTPLHCALAIDPSLLRFRPSALHPAVTLTSTPCLIMIQVLSLHRNIQTAF